MSRLLHRAALAASFAVGLASSVVPRAVIAADPPISTGTFSDVAADGYDVVAYFAQKKPVEGSKAHSMSWMNATWRFASAENLEKFRASPAAYAPQYGGYCAWAVAQGKTAPGNGKNWSVVDGKLYLNYDDEIQSRWNKDVPGFIAKANTNWPKVLE